MRTTSKPSWLTESADTSSINADPLYPEAETATNEPSSSRWERLRTRLRRFDAAARRLLFFIGGVAAALIAILLYNALTPASHQVTTREVRDTVAQAIASATPLPAFSEQVYQVIQPSLVLIQADRPGIGDKGERGLGSGVIINDQGDIITALHVVTDADKIQLTFADGTE